MRIHPITLLYCLLAGPICCGTILSGCVNSLIAPAPQKISTTPVQPVPAPRASDATDLERLRKIPGAPLSPSQGIEDRNIGKRIRWAGAVQYVAASGKGVCLTVLYALTGEDGEPRWAKDPTYQTFEACTTGSYDRVLVDASTNVTIVGTISGKTYIGMGGGGATGPVVQIEKLYRWSDCIEGDANPACTHGFLIPIVTSNH